MDKLKIVKFIVFLLSFCIVFLLCFAINQVILNGRGGKNFTLYLEDDTPEKIRALETDGNYLYIASEKKVYIINMKNKTHQGTVFLDRGAKNGQKK